jgi:peptidoglycan/LPS O-acetylase OafA/YrhL
MKYRAEIDGLRALAVLPVIFFHAGFSLFSGGFVGVDIFFVISGYLITTIILTEILNDKFSLTNFYERRARRILPALFFVMLCCLPFAWFILAPSDLINFGQSLVAVATFSSNFFFWMDSGYFSTNAELKPLLHTWSLAVEEQYYIIFPIFLIIAWRYGIKSILFLLFFSFLASLFIANYGAYRAPNATFFLLPTRGWELILGVFTAIYLQYNEYFKSLLVNQLLSILGFLMILFSIKYFDNSTPFPSFYALIPTIGTCLLILFCVSGTLAYKMLSNKLFVGIGLISYSAYLWHQPLLAFSRHYFVEEISSLILISLCLLSLLMAYVSWRWIESPFRNKNIFNKNQIFSFSLAGIVFFIVIGIFLDRSNGGINYYNQQDQKILKNFLNASDYVTQRFDKIQLKDFETSNNPSAKRVLLIGDSNAEDLTNAIYESNAINNLNLSGYYIPARCGSLMIDQSRIREYQAKDCIELQNFFNSKKLNRLIENADEVWISSIWMAWTLDFLDESIKNIKMINPNIKIFGPKYLGEVKSSDYKKYGINIWKNTLPLGSNIKFPDRRARLISILDRLEIPFIDLQINLCEGQETCPNFDGENLLTFDGDHLTKHGAKKLGKILKENKDI